MKIKLQKLVAMMGLSFVLAAAGCQPSSPDGGDKSNDANDASTIRAGGVDVTVDPGDGVDVDVDGPGGGKVDVGVDEKGVDVDVDK